MTNGKSWVKKKNQKKKPRDNMKEKDFSSSNFTEMLSITTVYTTQLKVFSNKTEANR